MKENSDSVDWSMGTWEGSRREQIRRWSQLTMDEILAAQEEMNDEVRATINWRRSHGLSYIDPYTGERVDSATVRETPPTSPKS
jgi:hypothetical protein